MSSAWILCGIGTLFCLSGIYLFLKNVYEENRSIKWPVLILVMGVLLIAVGTAKYVGLVK
jgi:hypothetical protein